MSTNRRENQQAFHDQQDERHAGHVDAAWLERWAPPCPDGSPQRLCEILGFRLKGADYLQLRVVLTPSDHGVCQAIIEEHEDRIYVRALVCFDEDRVALDRRSSMRDETDCPCNVWLDAPLDERVVIDVDSGEPLPLFIPHWDTDEPSLYVPRPAGCLWPPDHAS
jgi:hypothetical protein